MCMATGGYMKEGLAFVYAVDISKRGSTPSLPAPSVKSVLLPCTRELDLDVCGDGFYLLR